MSEHPERRSLAAEGVESLGRIRLQGFALLALAFIVGFAAGGAYMRVSDRMHGWRPPGRFVLMQPGARGGLPPFFDELDLTPDQRKQIAAILERRRPATDSILRASLPRLRAVTDSTRLEIRSVLTPAQREKMDRIFARERGHRARGGRFGAGTGRGESAPPMAPSPNAMSPTDSSP